MSKLLVSIEIKGRQIPVGSISGKDAYTAVYSYDEEYVHAPGAVPISICLPLQAEAFSSEQTRRFFEGLLPEGFLRGMVAGSAHKDHSDYLALLTMLGEECLGAVQLKETESAEDLSKTLTPSYRPLTGKELYDLAAEGAQKSAELVLQTHLSLTGASGKIGAYRSPDGLWYLPMGTAPSTHILKQSHIRYRHIVQNEQLCQLTARLLGIPTPLSLIVPCRDQDAEGVLLATQRYDRTFEGSTAYASGLLCPLRLHQEDFGQALGIASIDKYDTDGGNYMKRMFDLLKDRSASPIEDQFLLWDIIVFHYLIGNTDGHIKNYSLRYTPDLRAVRLAPAYDIVSTAVYENHSRQMALSIGGTTEFDALNRDSFRTAAAEIGLNETMFMERFDRLAARFVPKLFEAAGMLAQEGFEEVAAIAETIAGLHAI